jgi:hypothetical protein
MDKRAQIAKVLITPVRSTARSTRKAPNPATGCDPDRDVAGRELNEWWATTTSARRAYTRMCILEKICALTSGPRWRLPYVLFEPPRR